MANDLERDIRLLEEQERILRFETFGPDAAWDLGSLLRKLALERGAPIAIDISLRDRPLFHAALPGTSTDNAEWIRRKRNTVLRLWKSSYLVGRKLELVGRDQQEAHNLPLAERPSHVLDAQALAPLFRRRLGDGRRRRPCGLRRAGRSRPSVQG